MHYDPEDWKEESGEPKWWDEKPRPGRGVMFWGSLLVVLVALGLLFL